MLDLAIIASVIPARFELLRRSIITWQQSIKASGLKANIYLYSEGAPLHHILQYIPTDVWFAVEGSEERSGSHIRGYNHWYGKVEAKTYLFTHPDLLFPRATVQTAFEKAQDDVFVAFKVFWLPQHMTAHLDDYNWYEPEQLEQCEDIYKFDPDEHGPYYWNKDVREKTSWESTTTFAYNAATAAKIFPFPDLGHQGYDDPAHAGFRHHLGIRTHTVMEPILSHQWHPQTWDGNSQLAVHEAIIEINKRFG